MKNTNMDEMEVDAASQPKSQVSNRISQVESLWSVIHTPVTGMFSDLTKAGTEQGLRSFLESMTRSSETLNNILIPPFRKGDRYDLLRRQYTAFTSWLFGILFHTLGTQLSKEILQSSIEVQACMLRILYRLHFAGFNAIYTTYMDILDEIFEYAENSNERESIEVNQFIVESDVIESLDLTSYPVTVRQNTISTVMTSIMEVFLKSGVISSSRDVFWWKILTVLKISKPEAKLIAIKVASEMMISNDFEEKQFEMYITYNKETMRTINHWRSMAPLSPMLIDKFTEVMADALQEVICTAEVTDLCFVIIELIADKIIVSEKLEIIACDKIRNYLMQKPRHCTNDEIQMFTKYFENSSEFSRVLAHFVAFDMKPFLHSGVILVATKLSPLWKLLIGVVTKSMASPNFALYFQKILQIYRLLSSWLSLEQVRSRFFDNFKELRKNLFNKLEESVNLDLNDPNRISAFMCFADMLALNEDDCYQNDIQNILLLPWSQAREAISICGERTYNKIMVIAKSLNTASKMKCLESVCQLGKGKVRMRYLSTCVTNNSAEFGTTVILNSIFLLKDPEIKFFDINTHILKPALITQRKALEEALAKILGSIVCILSGMATITKTNLDEREWHVNCRICDNGETENVLRQVLVNEIGTLFIPYFQLFRSKHPEIRKDMVNNLKRFSNHISAFNSVNILSNWLPLIRDPNLGIRNNLAFSIEIIVKNKINLSLSSLLREGNDEKNLLQDEWPEDLKNFIEFVIHEMAKTLSETLNYSNDCMHKTLLMTVKEFARIPIHSVERRICNILIISILHSNSTLTAVASATFAYKDIAEFNGITPKELYIRYRKQLTEVMIRMAARNYYEKGYNLATTLHRSASCIGYRGTREFLRKNGNLAVCYLVPLAVQVPKVHDLFRDIAFLMGLDEKDMFIDYFQYICPHVLINETPEIAIECLQLVSTITKLPLSKLFAESFLEIFRELLLYFHENMERVINCLDIISKFDRNNQKGMKIIFNSPERLANYLKPQLHAVLVNFDSNLSVTTSDEYTQRCALASLAALIKFMGAGHLGPLKYKILATLRTSLGFTRTGFRKLACYAWDSFIRNVAVEELGPLLSTICVSLIPLLQCCPEQTNSMLQYLLIDNNESISNHISELFFIGDLQVSPTILTTIEPQIQRTMSGNNFAANLELWQKRIIHETDEVRLKALIHLRKFLEHHRSDLNKMILNDTNHVHPAIVQLLDALFAGCQHTDVQIRLHSGECLGELGGIEPSLLPRRIVSRHDSKFIAEMNGEFACALLVELVRAFQMLNSTHNVDCFSLAIQEILKTYEISPEGSNKELWHALPSTTQQIILPFLTSHYKSLTPTDIVHYPIYGTEAGSTSEKWIFNWACCMIASITNETLSIMLNRCRPAFKRDIKATIFCIPHIVIYCVINGNDNDRDGLINEILNVIKANNRKLDGELIDRRPLRNVLHDKVQRKNEAREMSDETRRIRCSQMIFVTLDHIKHWIEEKRLEKNEKYMAVESFFNRLNNLTLAEGCFQSREYHRALMYLERHMASNKSRLTDPTESGLLAKIYTQLEEPDGVSGILALQDQSPTLQQHVLAHEISGQLQNAATCYERLAQRQGTPKYIQGMIQCYLGLEQPFTATNITKGVLDGRPELEALLVEHEPFWRLAHFIHLDDNDINNGKTTIKASVIDNLMSKVSPDIQAVKKRLVSLLGAAPHQDYAYQQNYPHIMKLHVINEFEKAMKLILNDIHALPELLSEWEHRGQLVRGSRGVEFVLRMRRTALDLGVQVEKNKINLNRNMMDSSEQQPFYTVLQQEIGKIWLKSARIARKAGLHQQAYMYILSASDYCPPQELNIEQAQLYWQRDCQKDAFTTLKRLFLKYFQPLSYYKELPVDVCTDERKQFAKAKLLFAKYNDETVNVDMEINKIYYREAVDAWRCWEKSYLACAQYHDTMIDRMDEDKRDFDHGLQMQVTVITNYAKSLLYGCKFIHQSMPRMLTIWMNFALRVHSNRNSLPSQMDMMIKMTKIIDVYVSRLPKFMWLTVFSQLVSRICHPAKEVQAVLNTILVNLIIAYPQYCFWMMASVLNSSYPVRQSRCQDIMNFVIKRSANADTNNMASLIKDFQRLWQRLIEVSNKPISDKSSTTTISALSKTMKALLASRSFGPIMMPTSKFCQLHLPQSVKGIRTTTLDRHNPFITEWVTIAGIAEQVTILTSLQRPRRITLLGSDGGHYLFMCKPRDDLRRDFRLMEFNDIVNKYLQKDPESRQRRLYIRTYGVVPLNEECGLIEWIPNLIGFRVSILKLYKERGIVVSHREVSSMAPELGDTLEKKRHIFVTKLLPRYPPILCNWFTLNFPDSYGWYEARTAYIRTTAVMSMVGYILGLGDRHGDNILFDSKCGDCVHVDFNCLFNRGESFTWPERVPFRLTHNMVDAMGPLKYEGPFRRSCEITMRILRQEASTLISVLTPFVYDPLVSWTKHQLANDVAEKTNEKAVQNIKDIELRLKGCVKSFGSQSGGAAVNLSVEGQTNHLILDATNIDNLCQMYQGWTPYI